MQARKNGAMKEVELGKGDLKREFANLGSGGRVKIKFGKHSIIMGVPSAVEECTGCPAKELQKDASDG